MGEEFLSFLVVVFLRTSRMKIYRWTNLFERDFMELPAVTSTEFPDVAALRGFADNASLEVARLSEAYDSLKAIIVKFEQEEDVTLGAIALTASFTRAEKRMSGARERLAITS